jgi:hypothetical protein
LGRTRIDLGTEKAIAAVFADNFSVSLPFLSSCLMTCFPAGVPFTTSEFPSIVLLFNGWSKSL